MADWLESPAVQAGVAPLLVGFLIALALHRTRFTWLAVVAGVAVATALTTGFDMTPLTAGRKIMLLAFAAPIAGFAADHMTPKRGVRIAVPVVAGLLTWWVFASVLAQREGTQRIALAIFVAVAVGVTVAAVDLVRHDGLRSSAVGVGAGLAVGIAAVISASVGFLMNGVALAAGSGAVALSQVITRREVAPGFFGALSIGLPFALFAAGAFILAELPWYALILMPVVPIAATLPRHRRRGTFLHGLFLLTLVLIAAMLPITAAWLATRST
ncbi:MAG: hypothetical protein M3Z31_05290 [Pseudomonadota bacterium]|nr:hypothetical protein [Pseudomonadota bacterium]